MKGVLTLTVVCLISAACLAVVHHQTREIREANRESYENRQLSDLVPPGSIQELCNKGIELYRAEEKGYGGTIVLAVVYTNGELKGVRVLSHTETPGFADILQPSDWIGTFGVQPIGHVDAVARATITSKSIIKAVERIDELQKSGVSPCN